MLDYARSMYKYFGNAILFASTGNADGYKRKCLHIHFDVYLWSICSIFSYFTIWCLCRKNHYSCHINRAPFASLKGIDACADIEIQINEKKLFVHFIDIPFPVLRMFLLMNDREYRIHRSLPGKIQAGIGIRPGAREMDAKHFKPYSIPEFPQKGTEYHYLVIAPSYADAYFMNGQAMLSVTGECTSGNVTVCKLKVLKKRLKNELYAPMK